MAGSRGQRRSATAGSKGRHRRRLYAVGRRNCDPVASGGTGSATADVAGAIEFACTAVDAREIYWRGVAAGSCRERRSGLRVDGDDAMIIQSGRQASSEAMPCSAQQARLWKIAATCTATYSAAATLQAEELHGSAPRTLPSGTRSVPVYDQGLDELVAAATHAGRLRLGAGSDAFSGARIAVRRRLRGRRQPVRGGEASGGGRATVGDSLHRATLVSDRLQGNAVFGQHLSPATNRTIRALGLQSPLRYL